MFWSFSPTFHNIAAIRQITRSLKQTAFNFITRSFRSAVVQQTVQLCARRVTAETLVSVRRAATVVLVAPAN